MCLVHTTYILYQQKMRSHKEMMTLTVADLGIYKGGFQYAKVCTTLSGLVR